MNRTRSRRVVLRFRRSNQNVDIDEELRTRRPTDERTDQLGRHLRRSRDKYFHLITSDDRHHRQLDLHDTDSASSAHPKHFLANESLGQQFDLEEDFPRVELERRFLSDPTFLQQVRRLSRPR